MATGETLPKHRFLTECLGNLAHTPHTRFPVLLTLPLLHPRLIHNNPIKEQILTYSPLKRHTLHATKFLSTANSAGTHSATHPTAKTAVFSTACRASSRTIYSAVYLHPNTSPSSTRYPTKKTRAFNRSSCYGYRACGFACKHRRMRGSLGFSQQRINHSSFIKHRTTSFL